MNGPAHPGVGTRPAGFAPYPAHADAIAMGSSSMLPSVTTVLSPASAASSSPMIATSSQSPSLALPGSRTHTPPFKKKPPHARRHVSSGDLGSGGVGSLAGGVGGGGSGGLDASDAGAGPSGGLAHKRRCVSTACLACRKRKSKCDAALPSCAACESVYGTECVYDPHSDHRRKGVYRERGPDTSKARASTLQVLVQAILSADDDDVPALVARIRGCDNLDAVADSILKSDYGKLGAGTGALSGTGDADERIDADDIANSDATLVTLSADIDGRHSRPGSSDAELAGEIDLARKMGELRLEHGMVRFIGGTSHLIYSSDQAEESPEEPQEDEELDPFVCAEDPITSWTDVTKDTETVLHLMNMYFAWHYPYFTTLSKSLFYRDFLRGKPPGKHARGKKIAYCSSLLVNAMLALGCHFTDHEGAFAIPGDSRTKGDHFFAAAKRVIIDHDEYEKPRLTTVQALALMSVREAGAGREAKGWVYSGMSFRMAQDIGLNLDIAGLSSGTEENALDDQDVDARRITFWGCFLFDKCWSNYLGRLPQLDRSSSNVPKYDVFPEEEAELWAPYTDAGLDQAFPRQPARTRAIALQLTRLCEISSDLLLFFYHPNHIGRPSGGKGAELKKLSELHRRLEDWRRDLPHEFGPRDGQLPNVLLMHMFFHLQYIHLFRPFLKYTPAASPLPAHISPRRICTANASSISKLMRLYKKTYNLRQICNIAVYMLHSACTIHMLNLPDRAARRDVLHGVRHLEEIAEDWLCSRRTLGIISALARKWRVDLPPEASAVLQRADEKWGKFNTTDVPSPTRSSPGAGLADRAGGQHANGGSGGGGGVMGASGGSPPAETKEEEAYSNDMLMMGHDMLLMGHAMSHGDVMMGGLGGLASPAPQVSIPAEMMSKPPNGPAVSAMSPPSLNPMAVPSPMSMVVDQAMAGMNAGWASPSLSMQPSLSSNEYALQQRSQQQQSQQQQQQQQRRHSYQPPPQQQQIQYAQIRNGGARDGSNSRPTTSNAAMRTAPASPSQGVLQPYASQPALSAYALDGNEWFVKDGVSWQQNFAAWAPAFSTATSTPVTTPGGNSISSGGGRDVSIGGGGAEPGNGACETDSLFFIRSGWQGGVRSRAGVGGGGRLNMMTTGNLDMSENTAFEQLFGPLDIGIDHISGLG